MSTVNKKEELTVRGTASRTSETGQGLKQLCLPEMTGDCGCFRGVQYEEELQKRHANYDKVTGINGAKHSRKSLFTVDLFALYVKK